MRAIHALRGSVRAVGMVAAVALFAASQTVAADTYRPFVLAYTESGTDVSGEAASVRERLEGADFRFLGEYPVSNDDTWSWSPTMTCCPSPARRSGVAISPRSAWP